MNITFLIDDNQIPQIGCQLFDTDRKYESEQEEELDIKPEPIVIKSEFSDTESETSGLRITLKQCDLASNSSTAMTPRILKEQDRKAHETPVKINAEVDFTSSFMNRSQRLSPEQYDRIKEITSQRRREHLEQEIHLEDSHNDDLETCNGLRSGVIDYEMQCKKQQIFERLENLL